MAGYPELYRRLAEEILKHDGKLAGDAQAFVARLIAKLQAEGWQIGPEAEQELSAYLSTAQAAIRPAIEAAIATMAVGSLQSAAVSAAAEAAFNERWPDGLTLSKRLWSWDKETRAGLTNVLRDAIRQGKSANQTIYAMQRQIERAAGGEKFKIVEKYREDWVTELWQSAQTLIHDPKAKTQWAATVADIKKHIDQLEVAGTRGAAERLFDKMREAVKQGNADMAAKAVHWWIYDKQLYHLKRIARTEMATAGHRAVIDDTKSNDGIIGYQWRLSASHPRPDICDYYANIEMGLGKGVFTKETVPRHKAHPHCMCLLIPRATPIRHKGSQNYAEFIRGVAPERREQLLPKWAQEAMSSGVPMERLMRADGMGLLTKASAIDLLNRNTIENIVEKLAERANNNPALVDLWTNTSSHSKHIAKRIEKGHVRNEQDYFDKIKGALAASTRLHLVNGKHSSMELIAGDWSVILNHDGLIKTAYQHEANAETFKSIQTRLGHTVYEYDIEPGVGGQFKKLFD